MEILKLYELRREPEMRAARQWYSSEFTPESAKHWFKQCRILRQGSKAESGWVTFGREGQPKEKVRTGE